MDEDSLDNWFIREILVHEEALVSYLLRRWPNRPDVSDLRQDTYVRVYEAAAKSRPPAPRAFLFTTAANLLVDRLRRRRVVAIDAVGDIEGLDILVEEVSPERRLSAHEELRRLAQAIDLLPPKCREVVWLRRVAELSQKEVAQKLGIGEKSVEKHVMAGTLYNPAKLNSRIGAVWNQGGFSASAFANYTGGVTDVVRSEKSASFTTFDFNLRYATSEDRGIWSGLEFALSAQNVFDRSPPFSAPTSLIYSLPYDPTNYSAVGRFVSLSVSKHF